MESESVTAGVRLMKVIAALLILLLLAMTNPSHEGHQRVIRDAIFHKSPVASVLGVGRLASWLTEYHSLVIASYTTVGDDVVSIGLLGQVWVVK